MRTLLYILILTSIGTTAFAAVEQQKSLFSAGGQIMTDGTTQISANLGDVFTGVSSASITEVQHGFWTTPENQVIGVEGPQVTFVYFLAHPQPNPARTSSLIEFGLPVEQDQVALRVYDVSGRVVRTLFNSQFHTGVFRQTWDLRNDAGNRVPPGMYFYRLSTGSFNAVRKLVVLE